MDDTEDLPLRGVSMAKGSYYTEIVVCVGPPQCLFENDEAVQNAVEGCPLCRHLLYKPDGTFAEEYKLKAN